MISNSWTGFDFGLGEDVDMLRDSVTSLCASQDRAARRRDRPQERISARPLAEARRTWPARHHGRGEMGRIGLGLSRTLRGDGGDFARFRFGRAVLRRAFQSLREPDPPEWLDRSEKALSAETYFRRACRRARHVGAGLGLRRGVDAYPRRQEGQQIHPQRLEDVDHQWAARRHASWSMPRPTLPPARAASPPFWSKRNSRAFRPRRSSTSSACAAPIPASSCFRIARCRKKTCWAPSATASTF